MTQSMTENQLYNGYKYTKLKTKKKLLFGRGKNKS